MRVSLTTVWILNLPHLIISVSLKYLSTSYFFLFFEPSKSDQMPYIGLRTRTYRTFYSSKRHLCAERYQFVNLEDVFLLNLFKF